LLTTVLLFHDNTWPYSATTTVNLLNSWGCKIFPHPPHIWHLWTAICLQRWKSTSEVNNSTTVKMFKIKSRTDNMPRAHFFFQWRTWHIDKSLW
jgi:hypothetical protein